MRCCHWQRNDNRTPTEGRWQSVDVGERVTTTARVHPLGARYLAVRVHATDSRSIRAIGSDLDVVSHGSRGNAARRHVVTDLSNSTSAGGRSPTSVDARQQIARYFKPRTTFHRAFEESLRMKKTTHVFPVRVVRVVWKTKDAFTVLHSELLLRRSLLLSRIQDVVRFITI